MSENPIIRRKDELVTHDRGADGRVPGKVLSIVPGMEGVDFNGMLAALVQHVNMGHALTHIEPTLEYVVQVPIKYREALKKGELFLNENMKTGVKWPTLYERLETGKRKFVDNLPVKEEEILHGNPFESIAISCHNLYLQKQVAELADELKESRREIKRIGQGQMDDRIGLLLAGYDQIRYALDASQEEKSIEIAQGRSSMLTAQKQFLQTLKSRVGEFEAVPESRMSRFGMELRRSGSLRRKDQEYMEIQRCYELYLQATRMVAASYAICGREDAAEQVFTDAEKEMEKLDFSALETLRHIHKENTELFCYRASEYIAIERDIYLEDMREYDMISIQVSGEKLLEVFENDRTEKVSDPDFEQ